MLQDLYNDFQKLTNPQKGQLLMRFFKTGKGEYGEGDIFLGLTVPQTRQIAKKYKDIALQDIEVLLSSEIHEYRQVGLMILVLKYQKALPQEKKEMYEFYLSHTKAINNWDLVDGSAGYIVGEWLYEHKKGIAMLKRLAISKNLWERRIAIIATFAFIYHKDPQPTLEIADLLLKDEHDLIHKAVGWTLRELGKRISQEKEEKFLKKHYKNMPRTMLRYAIERLPEVRRKQYLHGEV